MLARIEALEPEAPRLRPGHRRSGRSTDARRAEAEIARGEWRGPLHGVPIALKDLVDTAGIATEAGMKVLAGRVPDEDATVAARLRDAGAVLLGKLAMTEGAFSEHHPERRAAAQSLEPGPLDRRLVERLRSGGRGGPLPRRARQRHRRLDPLPVRRLRRHRAEAELGTGQPPRHLPARPVARPCRADGAQRRRLRACCSGRSPTREPRRARAMARVDGARSVGVDRAALASIHPEVAAAAEQALDTFADAGAGSAGGGAAAARTVRPAAGR